MTTINHDSQGWEGLEDIVVNVEGFAAGRSPAAPADFMSRAIETMDRMRKSIGHAAVATGDASFFQIMIRSYQLALTDLIDRLNVVDFSLGGANTDPLPLQELSKHMTALLRYLEVHYPFQFSFDHFLPQSVARVRLNRLQNEWDAERSQNRLVLQDEPAGYALNAELQALLDPRRKPLLSYAETGYLAYFLSTLRDYRPTREPSAFRPAIAFSIEYNFNTKGWIDYCVQTIQSTLRDFDDPRERWERIQQFRKELTQLTLHPQPADPRLPALSDQLDTWLQAEADFLQKMALPWISPIHAEARIKKETETLVTSSLSVDQLGILFRAGKDLELLKTRSLKSLFDHLAPFLATTARPRISAESMRSKSYSPEQRDIEQVKEILMQLFKKVNSY